MENVDRVERSRTAPVDKEAAGQMSPCKRDLYWTELNDSQKIIRMHDIVKTLQHSNDELRAQIVDLTSHRHDPSSGELMVPMNTYNRNALGSFGTSKGTGRSDDWF